VAETIGRRRIVSITENRRLAHRFYDEACNQQRFGLIDELVAEDYQHHNSLLPPEIQQGRANFKQALRLFYTAFPDLQGTIEDLVADDEKFVARLRFRGTHQGELMGIPATGMPVDFSVIEIYRIAGGKIAEGWAQLDALGLMQQIGVIPVPDQAPA
jgi:steroid delta-isomerase-like uncharacterized protein